MRYYGDSLKQYTWASVVVTKYQKHISGPMLDRIDIHIEVPRVDYDKLSGDRLGESSESIRGRVQAAKNIQQLRLPIPNQTSSATQTCVLGRYGNFANCRMRVRA